MRRCAIVLALTGCFTAPVESPQTHVSQQTPIVVPQNKHNQIDVLVMVDNSSSMEPMQQQLRDRFPQFLAAFDALAQESPPIYADLHVGVVTSDYGAGRKGAGGCAAAGGGQGARLQTMPAQGTNVQLSCAPPTGGMNFLAYDYAPGGANNLPSGLTLAQAFTCMASVGSGGCGFEHQLESVYQALHDTSIVENRGFLRPDATLAIVFVTNEDDGSAPADTAIWEFGNNPQLVVFDTFLQTYYGIECGTPPTTVPYASSNGPLAGCVAAGKEFDVHRYIDFFGRPESQGGVKFDPQSVVLIGIDAPVPPEGPQIVLSHEMDPSSGLIDYQLCDTLDASKPTCSPHLQHSCHVGGFFGDPAVRLNTVLNASPDSVIASICDADWSSSMQAAAAKVIDHLPKGCIPAPVADPMQPDCEVEDHTVGADGIPLTPVVIPRCDLARAGMVCWRAEVTAECAPDQPRGSPQSLAVTVDRMGTMPPPETSTRVTCATLVGTP